MQQDNILLPVTTAKQAVERARNTIRQERNGEQYGLKVRFDRFNRAMGKYMRFSRVNLFAGLSGSGKSYLLKMITDDFLNYKEGEINSDINFIPVVLHFCFEMSSEDEILRGCANDLGISYSHLLSCAWDKKTKDYTRLTDEELAAADAYLDYYCNKSILFYETSGNVKMIYNTVIATVNSYRNQENVYNLKNAEAIAQGRTIPLKYCFVVNIDHNLLVERLSEKDTLELMANLGKYAIKLRKEVLAMVNLVGQLNNNIESAERILKPALHYPQKADIYAQGQLYNACDGVFVIHQPSMLKIEKYGLQKRDTAGLMHLLILKARHGKIGSVWLLNLLSQGVILPYPTMDVIEELNL